LGELHTLLLIKNSAHVLEDLLPYVCIVHDCEGSLIPFDTRTLWLKHLTAKHELNLIKPGLTCTLCADLVTGNHKAQVAHVEKHLIEIALSILPAGKDQAIENLRSQISSGPSMALNVEAGNDGGLVFITGGSPADFASKENMAIARKRAMSAFLNEQQKKSEPDSQTSGALAGNISLSTSHDGTFESDENPTSRGEAGSNLLQKQFPCLLTYYGCNGSYSSKQDWKRHHATQHIVHGIWRCYLCRESWVQNGPTVLPYPGFNRKDLFTQHVRRMHMAPRDGPHSGDEFPVSEENLATHHERCFKPVREPPDNTTCAICAQQFVGLGSWDDHMEHVALHLEVADPGAAPPTEGDWIAIREMGEMAPDSVQAKLVNRCESNLEEYLLREGLIVQKEDGTWTIGNGIPLQVLHDAQPREG
jgi:hypothetical protein